MVVEVGESWSCNPPTQPASPRGRDLGEVVVVASMPGKSPSVDETRKTYPFAKKLVFKDPAVEIFHCRHHHLTTFESLLYKSSLDSTLNLPTSTKQHLSFPFQLQNFTMAGQSNRAELQKGLYEVGMPIRRSVLSDAYVDNALKNGSTEFAKAMQEFTTAFCWGAVWDRPGLDRKQRSLINLSMLAATGKVHELAVHTRGAVNNGVSSTEIREVLVQVCIYMGVPAGMEAFKAAEKVLITMESEGTTIKP